VLTPIPEAAPPFAVFKGRDISDAAPDSSVTDNTSSSKAMELKFCYRQSFPAQAVESPAFENRKGWGNLSFSSATKGWASLPGLRKGAIARLRYLNQPI